MQFLIKKSVALLSATAIFASILVFSLPAEAQKRNNRHHDANRISWTQLVQKLERDGYQIREIEMKRNGWEANVTRHGERYELRLDKGGNIVRQKWDD